MCVCMCVFINGTMTCGFNISVRDWPYLMSYITQCGCLLLGEYNYCSSLLALYCPVMLQRLYSHVPPCLSVSLHVKYWRTSKSGYSNNDINNE